ncbi:MAG TPA: hypothetical protein VK277_03695 [Acidimicrobiales bacterium]|nr:hypothetical protein [Acidimicrobiales bacterium]
MGDPILTTSPVPSQMAAGEASAPWTQSRPLSMVIVAGSMLALCCAFYVNIAFAILQWSWSARVTSSRWWIIYFVALAVAGPCFGSASWLATLGHGVSRRCHVMTASIIGGSVSALVLLQLIADIASRHGGTWWRVGVFLPIVVGGVLTLLLRKDPLGLGLDRHIRSRLVWVVAASIVILVGLQIVLAASTGWL